MTRFYKATRPDGTSFYDRKTKWEVGGVVEVPAHENPSCCNGSVLHASTEPAETLVGGSWPCRLFIVEGEPVAEQNHKRGFFKLTVIEEIDAWQALGPNGQEIAALIERAKTITPEQAKRLAAAWAAARAAARDAAWDAAWAAAWDAALALTAKDLISPANFDALYNPWKEVMEK